jgi:hypothetical protein
MIRRIKRIIAELYKIDSLDIAGYLGYDSVILENIRKKVPIRINDGEDTNPDFEPGGIEFKLNHGKKLRGIYVHKQNIASYDLDERRIGIRRILMKKKIDPKEARKLENGLFQISDEKFFEMYNQAVVDFLIGMVYERNLDNYEMRKRGQEFMEKFTEVRRIRYRSVLWGYFNQLAKAIKE